MTGNLGVNSAIVDVHAFLENLRVQIADLQETIDKARSELEEQVEFLNSCVANKGSLSAIKAELHEQSYSLESLAIAKGISFQDLKDIIEKAKQQLDTVSLRFVELIKEEPKTSALIEVLQLLSEIVSECWELFSLNSRDSFKKAARILLRHNSESIEQLLALIQSDISAASQSRQYLEFPNELNELYEIQDEIYRVKGAILHFVSSVFREPEIADREAAQLKRLYRFKGRDEAEQLEKNKPAMAWLSSRLENKPSAEEIKQEQVYLEQLKRVIDEGRPEGNKIFFKK